MALFDDAWMKGFQEQWNAEPALKDALTKIEFSSVIGYGFPGDETCLVSLTYGTERSWKPAPTTGAS